MPSKTTSLTIVRALSTIRGPKAFELLELGAITGVKMQSRATVGPKMALRNVVCRESSALPFTDITIP
jgi:SAM-dependent MidA family methyltransferase